MLCELETDKVTVEVPSPAAGTLADIVAAEGETVGVDALLANIIEGAAQLPLPRGGPCCGTCIGCRCRGGRDGPNIGRKRQRSNRFHMVQTGR